MDLDRIAALLSPFLQEHEPDANIASAQRLSPGAILSEHQLQSILTYINILLRWNAKTNLTAIRDPEEIVTRHFGESLFAARYLFPTPAQSGNLSAPGAPSKPGFGLGGEVMNHKLLDLGSGAGFPGLPMKIWAPYIHLTLVESNQKKATFLKEVCRALTLTDVNVLAVRAGMPQKNQPCGQASRQGLSSAGSPVAQIAPADVVTFRAVERFDQVLPIAESLVAPWGRLALLISRQQLSLLSPHADEGESQVSLAWQAPIPIPQSSSRILIIGHRNIAG